MSLNPHLTRFTQSESESAKALESLHINDASLDDLALDFTAPGYDIELKVSASIHIVIPLQSLTYTLLACRI